MPVHWATLGRGPARPHRGRRGVPAPPTGHAVPHLAVAAADRTTPALTGGPALRGLFCGGTLADEAMLVAERDARRHPLATSRSRPDLAPRRRPARRRPRRHRLRRRRPDPRPRPPDDRPDAAARADRRRGRRPDLRGAAARPRPRPRRAPRPGRRARRGHRASARATAHADGRALPVVVSLTGTEADPQGLRRAAPTALQRPAPRSSSPTPPPPGTRSTSWAPRPPTRPTTSARPLRGLLDDRPGRSRPPACRCSPTPCATRPCRSPRPTGSRRWPAPRPTSRRVMADPRRAAANADGASSG